MYIFARKLPYKFTCSHFLKIVRYSKRDFIYLGPQKDVAIVKMLNLGRDIILKDVFYLFIYYFCKITDW